MTRIFLLFLLLAQTFDATAHDVDVTGVARIFIDDLGDNQYRLSIVDQQVPPLFTLEGVIPQRCSSGQESFSSYVFSCESPLNLQDTITLPWNLEGVVAIARWSDGNSVSAFYRGNGAFIEIALAELKAGASSLGSLAASYLVMGAEHIIFGFDHLLFVFGLLLLLPKTWSLVKTVTAFTVAHSITLGLAVLGFVSFPSAPVEIIIALSIVLLAREIIMGQRGHTSMVHTRPWLIAFVFGLFHGLGFAGALGALGLRANDIPAALVFFNLGVEAGQLGFIAAISIAYRVVFRQLQQWLPQIQATLAYGLGGVATYWFLQRLPGLLAA